MRSKASSHSDSKERTENRQEVHRQRIRLIRQQESDSVTGVFKASDWLTWSDEQSNATRFLRGPLYGMYALACIAMHVSGSSCMSADHHAL